ncbi:MAG: sigma-70 family RNA polymerase sigma factor [Gaiellaceae bacterium]
MREARALSGAERRQLIERHLPLARSVARRFAGHGERRDDLTQVAALALVRAVDRRDPARPEALTAYLARCIEGEIRRHLRDRASPVRLPRSAQGPAARARMSTEARAVADSAARPLRLSEETSDTAKPPDELGVDRALVAWAAGALDERERQIVLLRFFLDRTQAEVARSLALSQAQVSRLLEDSLVKMRRRLERKASL